MSCMELENQLFNLQMVCNRYLETDPLANWVWFAFEREIMTNRSTLEFDKWFGELNRTQLLELVKYCLNGDRSNDGIIKSAKRFMKKKG